MLWLMKTTNQRVLVTTLLLFLLRKNTIKRAVLKFLHMFARIVCIDSPTHAIEDHQVHITDWSPYVANGLMNGVWTATGVFLPDATPVATNRWITIYQNGKRKKKWMPNTHPRSVETNKWELIDGSEFYRPINDTRDYIIHKIITYGQPCRLLCVLEQSGSKYRVKIEIEPLDGWQPLCHPDDVRPWQYHISLGTITVGTAPLSPNFVPTDNFDFWADWEEVINTFHNKVHCLKIKWVSPNFTMMLSETDSIQQNAAVGRLRSGDLGHSSRLSISA